MWITFKLLTITSTSYPQQRTLLPHLENGYPQNPQALLLLLYYLYNIINIKELNSEKLKTKNTKNYAILVDENIFR